MFTRRSPQFAQAARLHEILVRAGNNQLPQDLEERSAQGFEFHINTAHHGDSRLEHGTLTADLPVTRSCDLCERTRVVEILLIGKSGT